VTVGEKKFDNEVAKETLNEVENEVESGVAKEVVKGGVDVFRCVEEASMLLALLANKVRNVSFVCLYVCQIACESVFVSLRLSVFCLSIPYYLLSDHLSSFRFFFFL
jgi:hypothetical protein